MFEQEKTKVLELKAIASGFGIAVSYVNTDLDYNDAALIAAVDIRIHRNFSWPQVIGEFNRKLQATINAAKQTELNAVWSELF